MFYEDISLKANNNYYLKTLLIEDKEDKENVRVSNIKVALNKFTSIVEDSFRIPNLVLSAFEETSNNFEKMINDLLDKNRTYSIALFKKAKVIYETNKGRKPRVTQAEALILANNELQTYNNELLRDRNGFDTPFFFTYANFIQKTIQKSLNKIL